MRQSMGGGGGVANAVYLLDLPHFTFMAPAQRPSDKPRCQGKDARFFLNCPDTMPCFSIHFAYYLVILYTFRNLCED
ncbi:hypothetical protein E2C01_055256 [Portunus trituberculatus]|uniref:Uncharacterized protein n=1 Tax=Portunus trituberculatus TaxID=210409 RepID=A0A5B7GQP8_PORTR|nr:hypothetical protein [Portunus trituberculatus]